MDLLSLPDDLLAAITQHLAAQDVLNLMSTQKQLYHQLGVAVVQASVGIRSFQEQLGGWLYADRRRRAAQTYTAQLKLLKRFTARYGNRVEGLEGIVFRSMRKRLRLDVVHAAMVKRSLGRP